MVEDTTGQDPLESWPETTRKSFQRLTPLGRTFGSSRRTCHLSPGRHLSGLDEDSARQNKLESRGKAFLGHVTHRAPGSFASRLRDLWYSTCPVVFWEVFRSVLWYLHQLLPPLHTRLRSLLMATLMFLLFPSASTCFGRMMSLAAPVSRTSQLRRRRLKNQSFTVPEASLLPHPEIPMVTREYDPLNALTSSPTMNRTESPETSTVAHPKGLRQDTSEGIYSGVPKHERHIQEFLHVGTRLKPRYWFLSIR